MFTAGTEPRHHLCAAFQGQLEWLDVEEEGVASDSELAAHAGEVNVQQQATTSRLCMTTPTTQCH